MKKFKCIRRCYFKSREYKVGEIYQGAAANSNFVETNSNKAPAVIDGAPKKKRAKPKKMSMQVPKPGVATETTTYHGKEVVIEKGEADEPGGDL